MKKRAFKKKLNTKVSKVLSKSFFTRTIFILISIILIVWGYRAVLKNDSFSYIKISENNPSWNSYVNMKYNFSIDFPIGWEVYEDFENVSPTINIYIPNKDVKPPFDHFANINNVSIFPKGLATEAVIGQSKKTEIDFDFESDKSVDYILEDGTVWATYINFDNLGEPWKPWGFIWSKTIIENIEYKCLSSKKEIDLDNCNPFEGDEFVRNGKVDSQIREVQEKIIKSFKIIEE